MTEVRVAAAEALPERRVRRIGRAARADGADRAEPHEGLDGTRARRIVFGLTLLAVALLVATVRRPPILDLPLLFEQSQSFEAVLTGERPDLIIDWGGPNRLGIVPVAIARHVTTSAWAPRLAVLLLAVAWIGSMHAVAALARRPVAVSVLVTPLLFGTAFYAGLFTFLCGVVALPYWTWALADERRRRSTVFLVLTTALGAWILYLAHITWLVVGGFSVATVVLLRRFDRRETLARVAGVLPVLALAGSWAGGWTAASWQGGIDMVISPLQRVTRLGAVTSLVMGGLRHPVERLIVVACGIWIVLAIVRAVRERGAGVQPFLIAAGSCCVLVAVCGPEHVDEMVLAARRWGGVGLATLLLALPTPRVNRRLLLVLAAVLFTTQLVVTATAWTTYARRDLDGFEAALAKVPHGARLFSVDLARSYPEFAVAPAVHLYAWAATERDARIASTFTDTGNGPVRWADPALRSPLAAVLLWRPAYLRPQHLHSYSHVLVHAGSSAPAAFARWAADTGVVEPVVESGRWALFAVRPLAAAP